MDWRGGQAMKVPPQQRCFFLCLCLTAVTSRARLHCSMAQDWAARSCLPGLLYGVAPSWQPAPACRIGSSRTRHGQLV